MTLHREKLQQAILYFLYHCDDRYLGKTKLMKLLYFLDFDYYQQHRESVTGARYERFRHGPVAPEAMHEFQAMEWAGMLEIEHITTSRGTQHHPRPLAPFDASLFTDAELEQLDAVALRWKGIATDDIVAATHAETPWQSAKPGQTISFATALLRNGSQATTPPAGRRRDDIINSIIGSQALEGVALSYDQVARVG
jgi:uncharacterized phage-associated protein